MEQVVLVNESDEVVGYADKLEAHQDGLLHRAISVLIWNNKGEMLIQQRSSSKYHWAGMWANSCCSHPRRDESYHEAAQRRVYEELGIKPELKFSFSFIYRAFDMDSGLTEHELDYVFEGEYSKSDIPYNTDEVQAVRWISPSDLVQEIAQNRDRFAFWFLEILNQKGIFIPN